ncbi:hypothetical protein OG905_23615 [Streptomyces sp. NBC_00322]|uniref:hypothetical protein n=1 Tax=Streptomyces sp. NBC_00322 TaxID=2975712 RepID=UPI002E2C92A4|nr:hypothetical protein [Streptomyces sp. NBC_00322]
MDQRVVDLALRRVHRPGQVFAVQGEAGVDALLVAAGVEADPAVRRREVDRGGAVQDEAASLLLMYAVAVAPRAA